jgi:hypothetical protein
MWITNEEAVVMYARFCRARFGARAKDVVSAKARDLEKSGDLEGKRVWNEVARELDLLHDTSVAKPS